MAYSGRYSPKNPKKYLGDPTNIWYRSLWERRVMVRLDENPEVVEWSSEEIVIPYLSPIDNRVHRYFPDFFVRIKNKEGSLDSVILEVKPHAQSIPPTQKKKVTKKYITEVMTFAVNDAKWNAAKEYCEKRNWQFRVITEKDLFGKR